MLRIAPWTLVAFLVSSSDAQAKVELVVHGETAPDGDVSVKVTVKVGGFTGQPALLFLGGGFAPTPINTLAGTFFIDLGLPWTFLPLGTLPASGQLAFASKIPNDPLLIGTTTHIQAYVGKLSNPVAMVIHEPTLTLPMGGAGDRFGELVIGGDFDSNGTPDVAITAARADQGAGEVRLFHGPSLTPGVVINDPTPQDGGRFGAAVISADITGDGINDLIVGAAGAGLGALADDTGEVWIFHGPTFQTHTLLPAPTGLSAAGFGLALAAGDFDGNGTTDLAVGAPGETVFGIPLAGAVYVYQGPSLTPMATLQESAPEMNAVYGAILTAGDVTGDGTDELLVGVPGGTVGVYLRAGEAFLYSAPLSNPPVRFVDPSPSFGGVFGCRLSLVNLVGGPDLDVVSGTPGGKGSAAGNPGNVLQVGEVDIFADSNPAAGVEIDDPTPEFFQHFGMDVSIGDVNGDGLLDLIVGSFLADSPFGADVGETFVFLGPDLKVRIDLTAPVPNPHAQFGVFVGTVDLDGDGRDEMIIGAPFDDAGGVDAGRAYVIGL